ncbi:MAG: Gfo/Idh/MocA family oxidoreductase [Anaerolineae bacterium]|nr:Gfo/Idh/MocA family oxidoreductase [Anaerolineae bacterium]
MRVGIIGCGNIFPAYVKGCRAFKILEVVACADLLPERAGERAKEFDIPKALSVEGLLSDPEIDVVINLTVPVAHAEISRAILAAGKHVHSEKPLAITREDGRSILDAAGECGLRVGCAPDTFLGGGLQTCRKLIDDGVIGVPVAATAFMASHGPEAWHPNPDFFYKLGGGPLLDMGPYYLTALVHLLGPVRRVSGSARISFPERIATSEALNGHRIAVEVPTHVAGVLDFGSGAVATILTSFDVWAHNLPRIAVYGSEGTLSVPDPNTFGGPVRLRLGGESEWREVALTHSADVGRGIGVADLAYGSVYGRPHRASGELAYHVLDLMHALIDSSAAERHILIESTCAQPAPLPVGLPVGELDASLAS